MDEVRTRRIEALSKALKENDLRCYLIPPSKDLYYLTGLAKEPSERLFLVAVWPGGPLLCLAPELEAAWVRDNIGECMLFTWKEGENPYRLVKSLLGGANALGGDVAIGGSLTTSHYLQISAETEDVNFVDGSPLVSKLRAVKDAEELATMEESCKIADSIMAEAPALLLKGLTEGEVARTIMSMFLEKGCTQPWVSVASGPNTSYPHHESSDRKISKGEIAMIDTGALYKGYNSDITRTFFLGSPPDEMVRVYNAVLRANQDAAKKAVEGNEARDVDVAARKVLLEEGMIHAVKHRTGHGIGLDIHEPPYASEVDDTVLEPGMTFTVEPGLYLDGEFGVRIEDVVAVTPGGAPPKILNSASKKFEIR
jgi:Xaa-Pro dipeptidase